MKRMGIVLLGAVCLIWSYGFSHAFDIYIKRIYSGESVTFAWDEVTELKSGEDISSSFPDGCDVEYIVHIEKKGDPTKRWELKPDPRQEVEISFAISPGQYYVGVEAAVYKDNRMVSKPSDISWSKFENCTNNNPFVVEVQKRAILTNIE